MKVAIALLSFAASLDRSLCFPVQTIVPNGVFSTTTSRKNGCPCSSSPVRLSTRRQVLGDAVASVTALGTDAAASPLAPLEKPVEKLRWRELKRELATREIGTDDISVMPHIDTGQMRVLLAGFGGNAMGGKVGLAGDGTGFGTGGVDDDNPSAIKVVDGVSYRWERSPESGGDVAMTELACVEAARDGKWKKALRKLKQLKIALALASSSGSEGDGDVVVTTTPPSEDAYNAILRSLGRAHLQGGRASEPARKIIEEMVQHSYTLDLSLINLILHDSLGSSYTDSNTNKEYINPANLDATLAIINALARHADSGRSSSTLSPSALIDEGVWPGVISGLLKEDSLPEAFTLLRTMIVSFSYTPTLNMLARVAEYGVKEKSWSGILSVLALSKAAGYSLDSIGNTSDGRKLLAAGVVAAEKNNNIALGLRLLTAAQKAEEVQPDRGDLLTIWTSSQAQNSALVVHSKAIQTACSVNKWKLASTLLDLMIVRQLRPNVLTYQNVLNTLCINQKSRKATQLLFDWAEKSKTTISLKPPSVQTFNTIVNCCEVCGESDLTTKVLDKMKVVHETDGNIITFNIALKRLAKGGNTAACEGLILGMLQEGIEPTVVTYTTVIGACAHNKDSELAFEWVRRMKIKGCAPNFHTYNTAFSACLDDTIEGTQRAAALAQMMISDVDSQLSSCDIDMSDEKMKDFISLLPDTYTKKLARLLIVQLSNHKDVVSSQYRPSFDRLVKFNKEEELKELGLLDEGGGGKMEECVVSVEQDADYEFIRRQREEV